MQYRKFALSVIAFVFLIGQAVSDSPQPPPNNRQPRPGDRVKAVTQPAKPASSSSKVKQFQFVTTRSPGVNETKIAAAAVMVFTFGHYSMPQLNDEFSRTFFEEFFESLDPNRIYFLASDLEEFSPFELILDDTLRKGDLTFPFMVYERFLQRVKERLEFTRRQLKKGFDFTKDETIILSRKKLPWAGTVEELDEIWRKRIKNEMLILKLQKELASDSEKKQEDASGSWLNNRSPEELILRRYENYYRLLNANDTYDVMETYLTKFMETFDPHSAYLNWRSLEDFDIDMRLSLEGIGAVLTTNDGYTQIVRIIPGGPCEKDGRIKPGDRIIAVAQEDGEPFDIFGMPLQKVVRLIRGPKGSVVRLTVQRTPNSVPFEVKLIRDEVKLEDAAAHGEIKTITVNGKKSNISYIYLPSFYADWDAMRRGDPNARSASNDVKRLIDEAKREHHIKGIIIDLRGNGGGSLAEAIKLAGLFIPQGPVVQAKLGNGNTMVYRDDEDELYTDPLIILLDHLSASASEIFAACMQDYHRAILIGDKTTHGKGTVQTIIRLNQYKTLADLKPGAVKYTTAKYYRITGHSTQKRGVTPDIAFPSFFDSMDIGEAKLPHVLPWDEIKPTSFTITQPDYVNKYLPVLKEKSSKRVAANPAFQTRFDEIRRFAIRQSRNTLTLNIDKRRKLLAEDEKWSKRTRNILYRSLRRAQENQDDQDKKKNDQKEKNKHTARDGQEDEYPDLILEEALHVMSDFLTLIHSS